MPTRLGYACINTALKQHDVKTTRDMQKATFERDGLSYVAELALQNVTDLLKTLRWNKQNDIYVFRITSTPLPWFSEYEFHELPNHERIEDYLKRCGEYVKRHNMRITMHPGHFVNPASETEEVVENSLLSLDKHGKFLDLMGLQRTPYYPINIHIGGHYGDKFATMHRFNEVYERMHPRVQDRLVVENDDNPNLYNVAELIEYVHGEIGIPVTFDSLHHKLNPGGLSTAVEQAAKTWPCRQLTHHSEQRPDSREGAHSDYIQGPIVGDDHDCIIEAKMKEQAVLKYLGRN